MKKVLLVDDEPEVIEVLKKRLEAQLYEVVTATDGIEGLEKASAEMPDAILLDVSMPRMDGFSMLTRLQSEEMLRKIPVIMVTASGHCNDIERGQRQGAMDYLVKPVDFDELLKYLRRYTT